MNPQGHLNHFEVDFTENEESVGGGGHGGGGGAILFTKQKTIENHTFTIPVLKILPLRLSHGSFGPSVPKFHDLIGSFLGVFSPCFPIYFLPLGEPSEL